MPDSEHLDRAEQARLTPTLLHQLRAGDPQAGRILVELYRGPLTRFCGGYLGGEDAALDAVQDVFCKVLAAEQVPDNFRAWVYKITRNHCKNLLRSRARRRDAAALPTSSRLEAVLTGNTTRLRRAELQSRIRHLIAALPMEQREVLMLRYVEGLSRDEVSAVLEIPVRLVRSRLFEALKKLRKHTSLLE